jgi:hypothetical protein
MGYIVNHAIIVEGWGDNILKAHKKAEEIFPWVSPVSPVAVNGSRSFFIPPDGSKEGWEDSKLGDKRRKHYTDWLKEELVYEDQSLMVDWVEIKFGGCFGDAEISESPYRKSRS